jgi:hypothetical protein
MAARKMKPLATHAVMARRYFDWARNQFHLAEKSLSPKLREDHLALAEYYLKLAEDEVAAAQRVEMPQDAPVNAAEIARTIARDAIREMV